MTLTCSLDALIPHLSTYFSVPILYRSRLICPRAGWSLGVLSKSAPITVLQKDTSAPSGHLSEWKCHLKSSSPTEWFPVTEQGHVANVTTRWAVLKRVKIHTQKAFFRLLVPEFHPIIMNSKYISSVISCQYLPLFTCFSDSFGYFCLVSFIFELSALCFFFFIFVRPYLCSYGCFFFCL